MKPLLPLQLETERLRLRQFEDSDWRDLQVYYGDAKATRYTFGRALSEGDTWRVMSGMLGHWQLRGYGPYALEHRDRGCVLGTVGFWYPNDWPEPEIKWGLAVCHQGQGFASEAARAILAAGRRHMPAIRPISLIHVDNSASIQLALALGATHESDQDYEGEPHRIYRHAIPAAGEETAGSDGDD